MKNHNKLIYLLPLLAVLVFIIFSYKWNDEIITFDLNDFETVNCLVEDGGVIRTTEYDPQMNIDLDEAQQINVIYIKLFEPIDKDTTITAYFTKNRDMKFDEEYSVQGTIYSGKKDVALSINEKICSLRIDFGEDADCKYHVKSITANGISNWKRSFGQQLLISLALYVSLFIVLWIGNSALEKAEKNAKGRLITYIVASILLYILALSLYLVNYDSGIKLKGYNKSDYKQGKYIEANDLEFNNGVPKITGNDPFIVYSIETGKYFKGIVYFEEKYDEEVKYQIYWAGSKKNFSENESIKVTQESGTNYITFSLNDSDESIAYIRLDYLEKSSTVKEIDAVERSFFSFLHQKFPIDNLVVIAIISSIYILFCYKINSNSFILDKAYGRAILHVVLVALPTILLFRYLFLGETWLFGDGDIATDSVVQFYPDLINTCRRMISGNWGTHFSFLYGLGNSQDAISINAMNWVSLFGETNVPIMLSVSIWLKMILAGIIAYWWSDLFGADKKLKVAIAVGYSFNAMFVVRGAWEHYATISFLVIFWLWSFEYYYRNSTVLKSKILFALANIFVFYQLYIFYLVFYFVVFLFYIFVRLMLDKKTLKEIIYYYVLPFSVFAILGGGDTITGKLLYAVGSNRMSRASILSNIRIKPEYLLEAFERTIGQAIGGITSDFLGLDNFLEGPAFYFGILCFLLVPVAFYQLSLNRKVVFGLGIIFALVYITIPAVRRVMEGGAGAQFKVTSFWIPVMLLLILLEGGIVAQKDGYKRGSKTVFNITIAICLALMFALLNTDSIARMNLWVTSFLFILIYWGSINAAINVNKSFYIIMILAVFCEPLLLSYAAVNDRQSLTKKDVEERFYNSIYESAENIKVNDESWYRIETQHYQDTCFNIVRDYYGTSAYMGFVGINNNIQNYYKDLAVAHENSYHVFFDTYGNLYAGALLGVKYNISSNDFTIAYGQNKVEDYGSNTIYYNKYALPIAYFYEKEMSADEFRKLSYSQRNKKLLEYCVVMDDKSESNACHAEDELGIRNTKVYFTHNNQAINIDNRTGDLLRLKLHLKESYAKAGDIITGNMMVSNSSGKNDTIYIVASGVKEIYGSDVETVWFEPNISEKIDYVEYDFVSADEYYGEVVDNITNLQTNALEITSHSEDYNTIVGKIEVDKNGILATSIPYDEAWQIYVDGNKTELLKVNVGFIGTRLDAGEHDIKIVYKSKSWLWCNKFKLIAVFIIIIIFIKGCLYEKKNKCNSTCV